MAYIVSQILGFIVFVFVFLSMQTKNITKVMLCQIVCNGLGTVSYILLGGLSGCGIYFVATIQSVVFFFIRKNNKKEPSWLYIVIFLAYIICSLLTFNEILDIAPMIAAILCGLGLLQKKATNYRIVMFFNGVIWIIYDVFVGAYTMLASHIFTSASALIGIIRFDILKKA